ncbi:hypothetical protein MRB53_013381 [Persea americana]|uniref:Uncharacterized protein n=1 Tax=Persea americana TaxID=3435 RepID=A0ACC2K7Y3_PERAE|nr:hypothetical protein MRB53_013381 [Persea americana]|eukprot:TRINITY_DN4658_c1_g1_i2.p1 TRINITY_DN4658_c1_g1~~TRINITY_DN4658_c1_g1_i2.p1  ORF type:complete len:412 (+),score=83.85 TRINITY_DN4658_c1_g1_i2:85-1320(+)
MVMAGSENSRWLPETILLAFTFTAAISATATATAALSLYAFRKKSRGLESRIQELETSLESSSKKCAAERQGRIRAQQALRKSLEQSDSNKLNPASYPMTPIATIQSCFSTRNGTPRQPLIVPLARACLLLDSGRVPPQALEGLAEYSHCWILYVFHLNTDLEKLWKEPSRSKFKAKVGGQVRVPRLKGGKMGVLATRSPHRPCPIGLTVAKVEAVHGQVILLSGVDLVNGTPVLDIKPYLPYSDSIQGATVPQWVTADSSLAVASVNFSPDFYSTLASCWMTIEQQSLYSSPDEFQSLIKQVLSWDIRSVSQRNRPHDAFLKKEPHVKDNPLSNGEDGCDAESDDVSEGIVEDLGNVTYHLILEGVDVSYRIDNDSVVIVEKAILSNGIKRGTSHCNYMMWRDELDSETN